MGSTSVPTDDFGRLSEDLSAIRSRLEDGGPEVSVPVLVAFVEDRLEPDQRDTVLTLIARYKTWYTGYWDVSRDLQSSSKEDDSKLPPK